MVYNPIDLKGLRMKIFKELQPEFAENIGVKPRTYQNYELNGVPVSKRPEIHNKIVEYSKLLNISLPEEYFSGLEMSSEKPLSANLDSFTDLEIIEYLSQNLERFKGLSVFRKIVGLEEVIQLRKEVAELTELVNKLKNQ